MHVWWPWHFVHALCKYIFKQFLQVLGIAVLIWSRLQYVYNILLGPVLARNLSQGHQNRGRKLPIVVSFAKQGQELTKYQTTWDHKLGYTCMSRYKFDKSVQDNEKQDNEKRSLHYLGYSCSPLNWYMKLLLVKD